MAFRSSPQIQDMIIMVGRMVFRMSWHDGHRQRARRGHSYLLCSQGCHRSQQAPSSRCFVSWTWASPAFIVAFRLTPLTITWILHCHRSETLANAPWFLR